MIENIPLAFIAAGIRIFLPELRFLENGCKRRFRTVGRTAKAVQKPLKPHRYINICLLGALQHFVVGFPLNTDLRGHAVETL